MSWSGPFSIDRAIDAKRKADLRRQRELEADADESGRVPRGRLADRSEDAHEDLPDAPPRGWARSGR